MSSKGISIGILIFIIVVVIVYAIVMLIMFSNKSGLFAPYQAPHPPADQSAFYPLGTITPMCQEEINQRNTLICASYYGLTGITGGSDITGLTGATGPCDPKNWPQSSQACPAPTDITQSPSNLNPSSVMFREAMLARSS